MLKVLKMEGATVNGGQQGANLSMNQTLEGHKGSVVVADWNPRHDKLTTSDRNGLIIVWMLHKGMWYEEMINNRNKSVVVDMRWSADGEKICIAYEDGHVIVGGAGGKRLWGKDLPLTLALCEWSPDGRFVLFGTASGQVLVYDSDGNPVFEAHTRVASEGVGASPLVAIDWHPGAPRDRLGGGAESQSRSDPPALALCFANGNVQLMRGARDDAPLVVRTGLQKPSHARWNAAGTHLAVAGVRVGSDGRDVNAAHFYETDGTLACSLRVPGARIRRDVLGGERDARRARGGQLRVLRQHRARLQVGVLREHARVRAGTQSAPSRRFRARFRRRGAGGRCFGTRLDSTRRARNT
jgi:WD repeat-containing protein 35